MTAAEEATWRHSSWAMVKTTGFPYEDLEALVDPRAADAVRAGADDDTVRSAIEANLTELLRFAADDRVLEAVFLSSPLAADGVLALRAAPHDVAALRSKTKGRLIMLASYVQRLYTKNESTSFFGPVHWARIVASPETVVEPGAQAPRRGVFFAHWAAQAVADRIARTDTIAPHLVPRIPPGLVLRPDGSVGRLEFVESPVHCRELTPPADPLARQLWTACDSGQTASELAAAVGAPVEDVVDELRRLDESGLVSFGLEIPMGTADPVEFVSGFLADLPEEIGSDWVVAVDRLRDRSRRFATAHGFEPRREAWREVGRTFRDITGVDSERNAGQLATDRAVITEDCSADWPRFDLGGAMTEYLDTELPRVLDLFYELPLARRRARVELIVDWFDTTFGRDTPVALDAVVRAAAADDHALGRTLRQVDDRIRRTGPSAITDQLWAAAGTSRVQLDLAWADEVRAAGTFDTWCVSGVDLFVASPSVDAINAGEFSTVVGEIHALHDQLLQGLWPRLHPDPGGLGREIGGLVDAVTPQVVCDPTLPHRRKTMAHEDVLPEIEFTQRSSRPAGRRMRSGDLVVTSRDGVLELSGRPLGAVALTRPPLWWWDAEVESVFSAFTGARIANMVDTVRENVDHDHLPRLTVGRTVVARETWWHTPASQRAKYRSYTPANQRSVLAIQDQHGLPDQVFARFAEEPKPVFVDFRSPVLVDLFARLLSHTTERVEIGEMVPGPDQLWLRDDTGRHPAELRIGYYRPASPARNAAPGHRRGPGLAHANTR